MTTTHDDRPAKASRSSCGFWRAATASPSVCYDADGRGKGTCYGYRPGSNVGRGNGHAIPGEGLFDSDETVGLYPAAAAQAVPERYAHQLGDLSPHPRRQVIPHVRYDRELRRGT
jgi:hypothetical protein